MEWSKFQQGVFDFVEQQQGSAIVEAVAGSGKTTTIVEACSRLKGTAYLAAFNKRMGQELQARIQGQQWREAGTFHSAGFKTMTASKPRGFYVVNGRKCAEIWEAWAERKGRSELLSLTSVVCRLVAAAKQHVMLAEEMEDVGL